MKDRQKDLKQCRDYFENHPDRKALIRAFQVMPEERLDAFAQGLCESFNLSKKRARFLMAEAVARFKERPQKANASL